MTTRDLDDIFKKIVKKPLKSPPDEAEFKKPLAKKKEINDGFADSRGKRRKTTEDGLLIYTAEELNVGKGGDTDDCPFDCWCCF